MSAVGVGLVAVGAGGDVSAATLAGSCSASSTAATWAAYSVTVGPLMRLVLAVADERRRAAARLGCASALVGLPQTADQDWDLGWKIWGSSLFATLGPLVAHERPLVPLRSTASAPNRATLAANLQPFVAAVLAVILLSEPLGPAPDPRRPAHRRGDPRRATPADALPRGT